jgi:hypothetical protein
MQTRREKGDARSLLCRKEIKLEIKICVRKELWLGKLLNCQMYPEVTEAKPTLPGVNAGSDATHAHQFAAPK